MADNKREDSRVKAGSAKLGMCIKCEEDIRPLYPVRYSLTYDALMQARDKGKAPDSPQGITDSNYNLRRIRQGYLYIYTHRLKQRGNATDKEERWLVFGYKTERGDSNGSEQQQENTTAGTFNFSQYFWEDGTPHGKWIKDKKTYPYAYVHDCVSQIYYAYSEDRWSPEMFAKMKDADARAKVMHFVNLCQDSSENHFPFSEREKYVPDFVKLKGKEQEALNEHNAVIRTKVGYNESNMVSISNPKHYEVARVIALHDSIGNLADISAFQEVLWDNDLEDRKKFEYAITIAQSLNTVGRIELSKDDELKSGKDPIDKLIEEDYDIDENLAETIKQYAGNDLSGRVQWVNNLIRAQKQLMEQSGNYSVKTLSEVAMSLFDGEKALAINQATHEYCSSLYAGAIQNLSSTPQGVKALAETLADENDHYTKYVYSLFGVAAGLLGSDNKAIELLGDRKVHFKINAVTEMKKQFTIIRPHFDRVTILSAPAVMRSWLDDVKAPRHPTILNKAYFLETKTFVGSGKQVMGKVNAMFQELTGQYAQPKTFDIGDSRRIISRVPKIKYTLAAAPEQPEFTKIYKRLKLNSEVGRYLYAGMLLTNILSTPPNTTRRKVGKYWELLQSPALAISVDALGVLESQLSKAPQAETFISRALRRAEKPLAMAKDAAMRAINPNYNPTSLRVSPAASATSGSARIAMVALNVGRMANILGVIIGAAQVRQGMANEDNAEIAAGVSAIVGGVSLFAASFISAEATGVLLVTGTVLGVVAAAMLVVGLVLLFFMDSELERWVKFCFWGSSESYWNDAREKQPLPLRIERSTKWATKPNEEPDTKTIREYFYQELYDFYDLTIGMQFYDGQAHDSQIELYCPLFKEANSLNKLIIDASVYYKQDDVDAYIYTVPLPPLRKKIKTTTQWLEPGWVAITFNDGLPRIKERGSIDYIAVRAKYPKFSEGDFTATKEYKDITSLVQL